MNCQQISKISRKKT